MAAVSIRKIVDLQRSQLLGLIELGSVKRMRKTYEDARRDLTARLADLKKRGMGDSFSAHHLRMVLTQVNATLHEFATELGVQMAKDGATAGTLSQRHLIGTVEAMEKKFKGLAPVLQVEQAGVFRQVYRNVEPSLLNRHRQSLARYGAPVVSEIRDRLAQSMLQNETVDQAVERVAGADGVFAQQRWRAERIVRTEMAYSYGVTKQQSMVSLRDSAYPTMQKKLIATFDDRTGDDSKELHGQTVDVDKPFIWRVKNSKGVVVRTVEYMYPPNRPNDREVAIPWMPSWKNTEVTRQGGDPGAPEQLRMP